MFSHQLADDSHHLYVALHGNKVAGYIWFELIEKQETLLTHPIRRLKLHHISVDDPYRGSGMGGGLIETLKATAKELNVDEIVLDVWCFNEDAIHFFNTQKYEAFNVNMWKHV